MESPVAKISEPLCISLWSITMRQAVLRFSLIIIIKYVMFIMKGRFVNIVAVY